MLKALELDSKDSCFNRAKDNEWLFVLLGRDIAAPATIRFWITERIRLGKNSREDSQIQEAIRCANAMEGVEPLRS